MPNEYPNRDGLGNSFWYFSFLFICLMLADVLLTTIGIHLGAYELNWFMRGIVSNFPLFLIVKLLASGIILTIFYYCGGTKNLYSKITMVVVSGIMIVVIVNNLIALLRHI